MKAAISSMLDSVLKIGALRYVGEKIWAHKYARISETGFFQAKHIFVVGCGHSGTSVLLSRLDNHSAVSAIRGETRFFQLDLFRRSIAIDRWSKQWNANVVLAEKTPLHVRYCDEIISVFPNAQIVGICRHPLDTVASLFLRHGRQIEPGVRRWINDNRVLAAEEKNGKLSIVVKYEDFVSNPEQVLLKVQESVGLQSEVGLSVRANEKIGWYATSGGGETAHSISTNHLKVRQMQINQDIFDGRGRYRDVLSSEEVSLVRARTAEVCQIIKYSREP